MMRDGLGGVQRVAVIGGTSDIGLAIARAMTSLGARRFVLAGRHPDSIPMSQTELPVESIVELDLSQVENVAKGVDAVFGNGDIDVVIVAAGILHQNPDTQGVAEMATVNGAGSIALLSALGDHLQHQGHGHLVILSSIAIVRPRPSNYWYGASKVGLDFAARGLADAMKGTGVCVSIVRPGFVHTKMTAGMRTAPFACEPEAVGRAVVSQVRNDVGGVVWVPSILRWVSYALRWLPRPLLQRLDR